MTRVNSNPTDGLSPADRAAEGYRDEHGTDPEIVVAAPGRVNLIGEHTDYNDGFVLPVAIDRYIAIAASARSDGRVCLHSLDFDDHASFFLGQISRSARGDWSDYEKGVAWALQDAGHALCGIQAAVAGNVPLGAGLSSSAAVEVATAYAFRCLCDLDLNLVQLAKLCQRAENEFVGMKCGIMDQFISALGKAQHALLIDCRSLQQQLVLLPPEMSIVVCDTQVERALVNSAYNERRAQCEAGSHLLGVSSLRDVSVDDFQSRESELPPIIRRRCRHVITENRRVLDAVSALHKGDLASFGVLMNRSHVSLRDDYEVSCPELDLLVEAAWNVAGVYGSRMTGGGFGGCTVSAVRPEAVDFFREHVAEEYRKTLGKSPPIYVCHADTGVRLLT